MEEKNKSLWQNPYFYIIAFIVLLNLFAFLIGFVKTKY